MRLWCKDTSGCSGEGSGEGSWRLWCRGRSGSTWFRRRFRRRGSGEGLGGFGAEPGHAQQGSGEGSGEGSVEGLGSFGAEPGQVQQGSREGSWGEGSGKGSRRLWFRRRFRRRFREALVQSQVRFSRVPKKVPEKVPGSFGAGQQGSGEGSGEGLGGFGAEPGQLQQGLEKVWEALVQSEVRKRVPEKVLEKVWEAGAQSQVRFNRVPEKVPDFLQLSHFVASKSVFSVFSYEFSLEHGKKSTSKSMLNARLSSIFSTSHKMPRRPRNLHLVAT